jgi:hypothetical protein
MLGGLIPPNLGELLQQNRVTGTPTFTGEPNPVIQGTAAQPIDYQAEVAKIFGGLQQPQAQQPQGLLQRILGAAAQGIGVATSDNPGAALLGQIQQQQQAAQQRQAMELQRQSAIQQLQVQAQLNNLNQRIAEQMQIKAEQRTEAREIAGEKRRFDYGKKTADYQQNLQKDLESFRFDFQKQIADINNQYAVDLEALRSSNNIAERRAGAFYENAIPLTTSGALSDAQVTSISTKIQNGDELSDADLKALGAANKKLRDEKFRNEMRLRAASQSGGESLTSSIYKQALAKSLNDTLVVGKDNQIYEPVKNGLTGRLEIPGGMEILRPATQQEKVNFNIQLANRIVQGFTNPNSLQITGPATDIQINNAITQGQQYAAGGMSKEQISLGLKQQGMRDEDINKVISNIKFPGQETKKEEEKKPRTTTVTMEEARGMEGGVGAAPSPTAEKAVKAIGGFLKQVPKGAIGSN